MNGMKINFEIIKLNESILKTMSNEKSVILIKLMKFYQ